MPTNRLTEEGPAAVCRNGVCAGSMDSRNGNATVTPQPRRNVLRGMCFLVKNIYLFSEIGLATKRHKIHKWHFCLSLLCLFVAIFLIHWLRFRPASSSSGMADFSQY